MKDLSIQTISKKQLASRLVGLSEDEVRTVMRYRRKLSVLEDAEMNESTVDARKLHEQIEASTSFSHWITRRIKDFRLVEGIDYSKFISESTGGRPSVEYSLTIETAKHLAMSAKTNAGYLVRSYFLLCEKILKQLFLYKPFRVLSKQNITRLQQVYEDQYRKSYRPEAFFPRFYSLIAVTATGATPAQWRSIGYPNLQDFMEGEDEQVYTYVQDTVIRMLEAGKDYHEIKDFCDDVYPKDKRNIFNKYKEIK